MQRRITWAVTALALTSCAAEVHHKHPGTDMAVTLLEQGISEANPDAIEPLISDDYRQHNPRVPDGPQGLLGFVEDAAGLPDERRMKIRVLRSFGDGDFAVTHGAYRRGDREISGMDVFRMRGGQFVEHWDVGMTQRQLNPSGHGLLDGTAPDAASLSSGTERTRAHVRSFVERGLVGRDHRTLVRGIARNCIQHDPRLVDGRASWVDAVERGEIVHEELVRVIARGQWALTQSRGRRGDRPVVISDLFRVQRNRITEHWVAWESVPDDMAHDNGML